MCVFIYIYMYCFNEIYRKRVLSIRLILAIMTAKIYIYLQNDYIQIWISWTKLQVTSLLLSVLIDFKMVI